MLIHYRLADALTLSGSHVEEVIYTGDKITNVVTGKITKIEKHPDADRLSVCASGYWSKKKKYK